MAYANTYFGRRLHTEPWDRASPSDKQKALIQSSDALDRLAYRGTKTVATQEREFPRDYNPGHLYWHSADAPVNQTWPTNVTDDSVLKACCENALALLDGVDPDLEYQNNRIMHHNFAGVSTKMATEIERPHILCGLASFSAFKFIRPLLADNHSIRLIRKS